MPLRLRRPSPSSEASPSGGRKFSVRRQLLLASMAQVVLLGVVANFSLGQLNEMHNKAEALVDRVSTTSGLLAEAADSAAQTREAIHGMVNARTPQERRESAATLQSAGLTFVTTLGQATSAEQDPEFQAAVARVNQVIARQTPLFSDAVTRAQAGKPVGDVVSLLQPLQGEASIRFSELLTTYRSIAGRTKKDADAIYVQSRNVIVALACAALILGWLAAMFITRRLARKAERVVTVATNLAAGDLSVRSPGGGRDEFGEIGVALNTMADELQKLLATERNRTQHMAAAIDDINAFAGRIASGDLTARAHDGGESELGELARNLNRMAEGLAGISGEVQRGTTELSGTAAQILSAVSRHNSSTAEQAASIAQTSVTIEQVRTSAEQAAAQADDLADKARTAVSFSDEGTRTIRSLLHGMDEIGGRVANIAGGIEELAQRSEAIRQITESVSDLAEQSNMLALNATIEAARAGEQGRGFAVVADQVRSLAEQSKQATAQVQAILSEIHVATANAVRAAQEGTQVVAAGRGRAQEAGDVIERLTSAIHETATVATRLAAGAKEQAVGMEQIGRAMVDVSNTTNQISEGAEQNETAAGNLNELAARLAGTTRRYRLGEEPRARHAEG